MLAGTVNNKGRTIYCHFSFKRPRGKEYGLFAVAYYSDFEGKRLITSETRRLELWADQQFITAIQSYENALRSIHEYQGMMREAGIRQVMLVTHNSTLAGWIVDHNKNKAYKKFMDRAVKLYRIGEPKEITIGVGLCEPRDYERSYKFCKEELAINEYVPKKDSVKQNRIDIGEYKSVVDILEEDKAIPDGIDMEEVEV